MTTYAYPDDPTIVGSPLPPGCEVTFYVDQACTTLAPMTTFAGGVIPGAKLRADVNGLVPPFRSSTSPLWALASGDAPVLVKPVGAGSYLPRTASVLSTVALVERLRAGIESAAVWLGGDSTGNNGNEWFVESMTWLAKQFPAYTLTHTEWSDALQAWDPSNVPGGVQYTLQTGSAGDANVSGFTTTAFLSTPDAAALDITGDIDIRVKVRMASWTPAALSTLLSKFGAGAQRAWRFSLNITGTLGWDWSADGTNLLGYKNSTAPVPFANGETGWVRVTMDVDNGAGGNTVIFFTSSDGITWTQLGNPIVTAGTTSIFNTPYRVEMGIRSGGTEPLTGGTIYYAEVRNGLGTNGAPVLICDLDAAIGSGAQINGAGGTFTASLGNVWTMTGSLTVAGSPGLFLFNASVAGQQIAYANDATRGPKLRAVLPADLAFISYSHNEPSTTLSYRGPYKQLADAILSSWPDAGIVAVTQNPRTAPNTYAVIQAHAVRNREIRTLAAAQRYALVDAYKAFVSDPRGLGALVGSSDGIHPTQDGDDLWRDVCKALFAPFI